MSYYIIIQQLIRYDTITRNCKNNKNQKNRQHQLQSTFSVICVLPPPALSPLCIRHSSNGCQNISLSSLSNLRKHQSNPSLISFLSWSLSCNQKTVW